MNWLFWKQHKKTLLYTASAMLLYILIDLLSTHYFRTIVRPGKVNSIIYDLAYDMPRLSLAVPLLLGLFWGAPLIAREYEDDTNKLIWTQSVSRRKWLSIKLVGLLSAAAIVGLFMSLVTTWLKWSGGSTYTSYPNRLMPSEFNIIGLMPIVYSVFAVSLGVAIGTWRKRTLSALAITLFVFVVLQLTISLGIRAHYAKPLTVVSHTQEDRNGNTVDYTPVGWNIGGSLVEVKGGLRATYIYQPVERFWRFQLIEAVLYTGLSNIAIAFTYVLVTKRDA